MAEQISQSIVRHLKQVLDDQLADEKYGNTSVLSILDAVDILMGFDVDNRLPVVEHNCCTFYQHSVPQTRNVEISDGRYMIVRPELTDFDWLTEESVKIMRARFLLIRGYYYPLLGSMVPQMRGEVVVKFFDGSVWTPKPGTVLATAMGM